MVDEPSLGIMPRLVDTIMDGRRSTGPTPHDVPRSAQRAGRTRPRRPRVLLLLRTGRLVLESPSRDLLESELVRNAYLGDVAMPRPDLNSHLSRGASTCDRTVTIR